MGKQVNAGQDEEGGTIQILIFPSGSEIPPAKQTPPGAASKGTADSPVPVHSNGEAKP
jgi:hypothetical protein